LTASREDLQPLPSTFPRSRRSVVLTGFSVAVLLALFAYLGLHWRHQTSKEPATLPEPREQVVILSEAARHDAGVAIETVQLVSQRLRLDAPGVLSFDETRTARIGSIVEGKVVSVSAEVGDRVAHGKVLAEIHSHVIHEAWAEYRKALADRKRRQTELDYAVQAEQRAQRLYKDSAISLQEQQRAQVDRIAAEQALDMASTELRRAEEGLEHLGITLGDDPRGESGEQIPVRSPLTGAVLERTATTGTAVTPGMPLFVVSDLSTLWALAEVDETKLSRLAVGLPVELRVAAYPDETFPGTVIFIGDTLDPKTRRVTVRCRVPNPQGRLKPQMYATLFFGEGEPRSVLTTASQAVQDLHGKPVVFVADGAGKFTAREVTLGSETGGRVEILAGLHPAEKIVTTGSFLLKSELSKSSLEEE
jgi:cobalt-zinc-cadmium efflux system membrane fusion protein